jgi:hypothetical protein
MRLGSVWRDLTFLTGIFHIVNQLANNIKQSFSTFVQFYLESAQFSSSHSRPLLKCA